MFQISLVSLCFLIFQTLFSRLPQPAILIQQFHSCNFCSPKPLHPKAVCSSVFFGTICCVESGRLARGRALEGRRRPGFLLGFVWCLVVLVVCSLLRCGSDASIAHFGYQCSFYQKKSFDPAAFGCWGVQFHSTLPCGFIELCFFFFCAMRCFSVFIFPTKPSHLPFLKSSTFRHLP